MELDSRNLVRAATVLGVALVIGCAVLAGGIWLAMDHASDQLGRSIAEHGTAVAGAGVTIGTSLNTTSVAVARHAEAMEASGKAIANPRIRFVDPVAIKQPVQIRGPREDGSLPVNATLGD